MDVDAASIPRCEIENRGNHDMNHREKNRVFQTDGTKEEEKIKQNQTNKE